MARRTFALYLVTAFSACIFLFTWAAFRKQPRLLLRITPQGFYLFRRWDVVNQIPYRTFAPEGAFFAWSQFAGVSLETRTAAFVENTKERVLRLTPRNPEILDRRWSQDERDPDLLIQASEQSVAEGELLRIFQAYLRN
jgi:hypothetical protein